MKNRYYKIILAGLVLGIFISGCTESEDETTEGKQITGIEALSTERPKLTTERKTEEEIIIEEPVTTEAPDEPEVMTELEGELADIVSARRQEGALVSVHVERLSDGAYVSLSDGQMQSASLIKLFVAGCVYENMADLTKAGASEDDIESLVRRMITVSDNDATNDLVNRLGNGLAERGMKKVTEYCSNHGFDATSMGRLMLDTEAENDNYTSVADCNRFLKKIYNNELEGSSTILGYMKQQERRSKIPAAIPAGVSVANKTGELDTVENDVAIVFTDTDAYTICVMMSGLNDTSAGRSAIVNMSAKTYEYMTTGKIE